ncbi:MAG: biotin/lipoyl-containing protein [Bacillota bacterium]|nr:biotin/lipoyl-containing protein [Bacillota bacterium]
MKLDFIKQIMSEFDQSNVTKMKVEIDDLKIELEKESEKVEYVKPVEKEKKVVVEEPIKPMQTAGTPVKSPIVGVFYSASSPESEPYVTVGKTVKKGDIVCIIEAMKVMNEIKAPCDGTVTSILVENEALVEYDQALMVIE